MKLTIQKIFLSILAFAISIASAVIGMYMLFLADMVFHYRLLFAAVFMFNPILTGFLIAYMFKKALPKEKKEVKESKEDDRNADGETSEVFHTQQTYMPAEQPVSSPLQQPGQTGHEISFSDTDGADAFDTAAESGYAAAPGSDYYQSEPEDVTGYDDISGAGAEAEISSAESDRSPTSRADIKSKLKFWEKNREQ